MYLLITVLGCVGDCEYRNIMKSLNQFLQLICAKMQIKWDRYSTNYANSSY